MYACLCVHENTRLSARASVYCYSVTCMVLIHMYLINNIYNSVHFQTS